MKITSGHRTVLSKFRNTRVKRSFYKLPDRKRDKGVYKEAEREREVSFKIS